MWGLETVDAVRKFSAMALEDVDLEARAMTKHRRNPPTQKALPLPDWPQDRSRSLDAAQANAGVLDDGGVASHLSAQTREDLTRRYAYFLSFLAKQGRLESSWLRRRLGDRGKHPDYVRYLEPRVSSVTLAQSLYKIRRVAACLAPGRDWRWLKRVVQTTRPSGQAARQAQ